ncbi:MAG TPA: dihydroorotate dehydrogenase electron transfer subunit [Candidatus Omnitrophota bacterium]|nr:dihydroorotate dehydrogenase electron transfer subunit [Candidatus Omnitrophota bacterium]
MKMLNRRADIVSQKQVAALTYRLSLRAPDIAAGAVPGQFVMVKVSSGTDPLIRRPLSIHAVEKKTIAIMYDIVGPATALLAQRRPGDSLDILGPLGSGFNLRIPRSSSPVIVAGGIGVAPLLFLAQQLVRRAGIKPLVLIGARTRGQIVCAAEFQRLGCAVHLATDDGTCGVRCRVPELLEKFLDREINVKRFAGKEGASVRLYACGPKPMLRQISRIATERHIRAQISLEAHMACGIGACLGCVVKTVEGFKRVCKDGPVFEAQEIAW